jgi:predicted DCC family thiol-disulfide oxidoreductase YuxK
VRPIIVLYDADCPFCRWSLAKLLGWDGGRRLRALPLQDRRAARLLPDMDEQERLGSWHLVTPNGGVHSGGSAFAPLFGVLPGGAPLARLAAAVPRISERMYGWVSRHRGGLGRLIPGGALERADRRIRRLTLAAGDAA